MRVISGIAKGRKLFSLPEGSDTRSRQRILV